MSGPLAPGGAWTGWPDERPRPHSALIRFAIVLAVSLVLVVLVVGVFTPAAPPAACPPPPAPCNVPPVPPGALPSAPAAGQGGAASTTELVIGTAWTSPDLGFSLHYDPGTWVVQENQKDLLELISPSDAGGSVRDDWVIVEGVPAAGATPQQLIGQRVASLARSVPDLVADSTSYYQVNGPEIGDVAGTAAVYVGTLDDTDGTPLAPVRYTIVAASDGRITIAVTVRTLDPDEIADHGPPVITWHMYSRQLADLLLQDIRWPAAH